MKIGGFMNVYDFILNRRSVRRYNKKNIDAARIDGVTEFGIYIKVILPLSRTILLTLVILNFVFFWDEFIRPFIIATSDRTRTLPIAIAMFISSYQTPVNQMFAVSITAIVPILVVYFFVQKHFIKSLTLTGLK